LDAYIDRRSASADSHRSSRCSSGSTPSCCHQSPTFHRLDYTRELIGIASDSRDMIVGVRVSDRSQETHKDNRCHHDNRRRPGALVTVHGVAAQQASGRTRRPESRRKTPRAGIGQKRATRALMSGRGRYAATWPEPARRPFAFPGSAGSRGPQPPALPASRTPGYRQRYERVRYRHRRGPCRRRGGGP
jgi:hypothetical protein